jgi:hypothetical protein
MNTTVTLHQHPDLPVTPVVITAEGELGVGSDHSWFQITNLDMSNHPHFGFPTEIRNTVDVLFQHGPIPEVGHNGVTIEHLLAICGHRLTELQSGKFASEYNARALEHIQGALASLNQRTLDRMARQVEGTYAK